MMEFTFWNWMCFKSLFEHEGLKIIPQKVKHMMRDNNKGMLIKMRATSKTQYELLEVDINSALQKTLNQ